MVFTSMFWAVGASCTLSGQNQGISIQDLMNQWITIERHIIKSGQEMGLAENRFIGELDEFHISMQLFLDSELYQIYRLVPLPFGTRPAFGQLMPDESPGVHILSDLLPSIRKAVLDGDRERAMLVSADISGALIQIMIQDGNAQQFAADTYFALLLIFIVFIAFTAFATHFLYRTLTRSFRREEEGSSFSQAVLLAQENERGRLYRELHDTVAQDLRYLSLEMNKIGKTEEKTLREKLCTDAASLQATLIGRLRGICNNLVPPDFSFQGLPDALRRLCLDFGKRTGIDCRINIGQNVSVSFLNEEKQLQVFRIVQEALTNVEKHARAKEAIVIMRSDAKESLFVSISDDGLGFTPTKRKGSLYQFLDGSSNNLSGDGMHLGIRGMRERATLLGGHLTINSERGEGTLIHLHLPPHPPIYSE